MRISSIKRSRGGKRENAGAKPKIPDEKVDKITVSITPKLGEILAQTCSQRRMNRSALIRELLNRALREIKPMKFLRGKPAIKPSTRFLIDNLIPVHNWLTFWEPKKIRDKRTMSAQEKKRLEYTNPRGLKVPGFGPQLLGTRGCSDEEWVMLRDTVRLSREIIRFRSFGRFVRFPHGIAESEAYQQFCQLMDQLFPNYKINPNSLWLKSIVPPEPSVATEFFEEKEGHRGWYFDESRSCWFDALEYRAVYDLKMTIPGFCQNILVSLVDSLNPAGGKPNFFFHIKLCKVCGSLFQLSRTREMCSKPCRRRYSKYGTRDNPVNPDYFLGEKLTKFDPKEYKDAWEHETGRAY